MAWFGKAAGAALGSLVGGPIGAGVGVFLGSILDDSTEEEAQRISAVGSSVIDDVGEHCEITVQTPVPADAVGLFLIQDGDGRNVKAVADVADEDGEFSRYGPIRGGKCACYIPYTALLVQKPGDYRLVFRVIVTNDEPRLLGETIFVQHVPACGPWDRVAYLLPTIRLCMYVAMADGDLSRASLRAVRRACEDEACRSADTQERMRRALKETRAYMPHVTDEDVRDAAEAFRRRYPYLEAQELAGVFLSIARADGPCSHRRTLALQRVLTLLGMTDSAWHEFATAHSLDGRDYFAVLGLDHAASVQEVRQAYRRLIRQCHPDLFAGEPPEVQADAHRRSIELREAYDALISRLPADPRHQP